MVTLWWLTDLNVVLMWSCCEGKKCPLTPHKHLSQFCHLIYIMTVSCHLNTEVSRQGGWGSDSVATYHVSCFNYNQGFKGVVSLNAAFFTPIFALLSFQWGFDMHPLQMIPPCSLCWVHSDLTMTCDNGQTCQCPASLRETVRSTFRSGGIDLLVCALVWVTAWWEKTSSRIGAMQYDW